MHSAYVNISISFDWEDLNKKLFILRRILNNNFPFAAILIINKHRIKQNCKEF